MHLLGSFGPGGAEMGVARLINHFPDPGIVHSVCSMGPDLSMQLELHSGVPCYSLGLQGSSYTAFRGLARLVKNREVDILHVNNLAPWPDALVASKLTGCVCIETFHGVEVGQHRFPWRKRTMFRVLANRSAAVTAVSGAARQLLSELTDIAGSRVQVITNGIDCDAFTPPASREDKASRRTDLGLPAEGILLCCLAGLRPVKGHRELLRNFAEVPAAKGMRLLLVGSGPEEAPLKELSLELGLENRVYFLGQRHDVPGILKACDLFVLNSDTEGLSYAVLEAMACGLPIVVTAVGANPELVENGKEGWLYPVGDGSTLTGILNRIAGNPGNLEAMGREARKKVEKSFGITAMAEQYAALYRQVIGQGLRKAARKTDQEKI